MRISDYMVAMIDEALKKRRCCRKPSARAKILKCSHFVKTGHGFRLLAVASIKANFNKFSMHVFCVYT